MNRKLSYKLRTGQAKLPVREMPIVSVFKEYKRNVEYTIGDKVIINNVKTIVTADYSDYGACYKCSLPYLGKCNHFCTKSSRRDKTHIIFKPI